MFRRGIIVIRGHLSIPDETTLTGTFDAPTRTQYTEGKLEKEKGSILLAYPPAEDKGHDDGEPFITLPGASHLHGLIIFYPEQTPPSPDGKGAGWEPTPYPWTIRGDGDNCSITDCLLINPYQEDIRGSSSLRRTLGGGH